VLTVGIMRPDVAVQSTNDCARVLDAQARSVLGRCPPCSRPQMRDQIPFDRGAPDLHKWENETGLKLAEAVIAAPPAAHGVFQRHQYAPQVRQLAWRPMMENRLDRAGIAELVHIRGRF
jgi:hypothetical protein